MGGGQISRQIVFAMPIKPQKVLAVLLFSGSLLFLCSCYTVGNKFILPNTDELQLGKLQPTNCIALFGKPTSTQTKTLVGTSYLYYQYDDALVRALSVSERVLLLEFKDGKLNGYFLWSSFDKDKTEVNMKNLDKLEDGVGRLSKEDVLNMLGKPNAKAFCPTMIDELKENCATNSEVWGWYMRGVSGFDSGVFDMSQVFVWFDAFGKVSSVDASERRVNPNKNHASGSE